MKKCEDPALVLCEILKDYGFSPSLAEQILDSINEISGKQFFSSEYQLVKDRESLIVSRLNSIQEEETRIVKVKDLELSGFKVEEFAIDKSPDFSLNPNVLYVDTAKLATPLILRHWCEGDRFYPFGMRGSKKLSDFFIDQKINLIEKKNIPVLCSGDKIVWLVGYRGDDRFKIDNQTKKYYKITYHGSF